MMFEEVFCLPHSLEAEGLIEPKALNSGDGCSEYTHFVPRSRALKCSCKPMTSQ